LHQSTTAAFGVRRGHLGELHLGTSLHMAERWSSGETVSQAIAIMNITTSHSTIPNRLAKKKPPLDQFIKMANAEAIATMECCYRQAGILVSHSCSPVCCHSDNRRKCTPRVKHSIRMILGRRHCKLPVVCPQCPLLTLCISLSSSVFHSCGNSEIHRDSSSPVKNLTLEPY
jgi:hypothetical protein